MNYVLRNILIIAAFVAVAVLIGLAMMLTI